MGFGAIVTVGQENKLLKADVLNRMTEIRVEQTMDDPTRFAIRLEDDICKNEFEMLRTPDIQCGTIMAVAVKINGETTCLVRGPVTDVHSNFMLGGAGSSFEIRGEDRRIEMTRTVEPSGWSGKASDVATILLVNAEFTPKVRETNIIYGGTREDGKEVVRTLNQRCSDLYFISEIARDNNLHFWIDYHCNDAGDRLEIEEFAHLQPSPDRADISTPDAQVQLKPPKGAVTLRINVADFNTSNVTTFSFRMEAERPNKFDSFAIDDRTVQLSTGSPKDPQQPIRKDGVRFPGIKFDRDMCITTAGSPEELEAKAQAALTRAGWFLNANASTTTNKLCSILQPHDIVSVQGLGNGHDGAYQVTSVTHVINAADHFMDLGLRRNAIGK
jgi:hypothetical protein